jgi:hypothetical protein
VLSVVLTWHPRCSCEAVSIALFLLVVVFFCFGVLALPQTPLLLLLVALFCACEARTSTGFLKSISSIFPFSSSKTVSISNYGTVLSLMTNGVDTPGTRSTCFGLQVDSNNNDKYQVNFDLGQAFYIRSIRISTPTSAVVTAYSSTYWSSNIIVRTSTNAVGGCARRCCFCVGV